MAEDIITFSSEQDSDGKWSLVYRDKYKTFKYATRYATEKEAEEAMPEVWATVLSLIEEVGGRIVQDS